MGDEIKYPFYSYLTDKNRKFINSLPDLLGETTVTACLNLILDDLRLHKKRTIEIIYLNRP